MASKSKNLVLEYNIRVTARMVIEVTDDSVHSRDVESIMRSMMGQPNIDVESIRLRLED